MSHITKLLMDVPTYYGCNDPSREEWGIPDVPVLVNDEEGLRVVLGSQELGTQDAPSVIFERRPNGWVILVQPYNGGFGDEAVAVYVLDDHRVIVVPASNNPPSGLEPARDVEVLKPYTHVPEVDLLPETVEQGE